MDTARRQLMDAALALSNALTRVDNDGDSEAYEKKITNARDLCLALQKEATGIDFMLCALASRAQEPLFIPSPWDKRRRPDLDAARPFALRPAPVPAMPDVPMAR